MSVRDPSAQGRPVVKSGPPPRRHDPVKLTSRFIRVRWVPHGITLAAKRDPAGIAGHGHREGPELRAQRVLNKARIPEMARYITRNRDGYIFSAITASIDAEVNFKALASGAEGSRVGLLHIPMKARFIINDGQHNWR